MVETYYYVAKQIEFKTEDGNYAYFPIESFDWYRPTKNLEELIIQLFYELNINNKYEVCDDRIIVYYKKGLRVHLFIVKGDLYFTAKGKSYEVKSYFLSNLKTVIDNPITQKVYVPFEMDE